MSVPYYLGMQAIAERLGYKNRKTVMKLVIREGLPIYKRRIRTRTGATHAYSISESAVTAWEIAKGQRTVAELRARCEQWKDKKRYALAS